MSKTSAWILLALLTAAGVYGFFHERLWAESFWSADGRERFLSYTAVYWTLAGLILWRCPRWLGIIIPSIALLYTTWWTGPVAPLSVLYFLGSCYFLGRIVRREKDAWMATLLGAAVWMFLIWIAMHFPINTRAVYGVAFALPYFFGYKFRHRTANVSERPKRPEAAALALLLFILIAHLLAALKPENSADGLSMHLALPMAVAGNAGWAFDFGLNSWALMPNAADGLYAAMYVLGGEHAAHVLNFAFLALICLLVASCTRRLAFHRVSPALAWLIAALFASTPLVQLVTGSLFVENVWAAMILAATLALVRSDVVTAAVFVGSALAVKVIAGAFAVPIAIIAAAVALRQRQWTRALATAGFLILFAAPPYVYAYAKTGNPVFPFANAKFKSPDFDTAQSFVDLRFTTPISWRIPYDMTFHSKDFLEAQGGGAGGFQYFLLLAPALLLTRRKEQWTIVAIAGIASAIILYEVPYLRYLYPAMPLASIAIAWFIAEVPTIAGTAVLLALTGLNLWFLPSSGFFNQDFALFRHADIRPYLERTAPVRFLIEDLNHRAPGEPVAFFSNEQTGGLIGPAYTDTWHNERYWSKLKAARDPREIAVMLDQMGIHYVVAPASRSANLWAVQLFLRVWIDPVRPPLGPLGLFRLLDVNAPHDTAPIPPGRYDDLDMRVQYTGPWRPDVQFPESSEASLTYSDTTGAAFRITFTGRAITYVFTQAANRGIAEVTIDGGSKTRINQYSKTTNWQVSQQFGGLKPGVHTLEVRVSGEKDAQSSGLFVDLDAFQIDP